MRLNTSNKIEGRNRNGGLLLDVKIRKGRVEMEIQCRLFFIRTRESWLVLQVRAKVTSGNGHKHELKSGSGISHSTVSIIVGGFSGQPTAEDPGTVAITCINHVFYEWPDRWYALLII